MALKGNLRDFSTTQLLNLVYLARKTGKLNVNGQSQTATLFFREGRLVHASSSTAEGHLAAILLKTGKLTREQADALNHHTGASDRGLGKYLMDARWVSRDDIVQGVKDYMLEIVYDLFTWAEGEFFFEQNSLPASNRITVSLNLDNVILECSRRSQEFDRLLNELPDLGIITLKITDKPLRDVKLTQDDWRVISHIYPHNTVQQIAQKNNMDAFKIRKIVYGMLQAGLVELTRPEGLEQKVAKIPPTRAGRRTASQPPGGKTQRGYQTN